jgi:hypothetical protein
MVDKDSTLSSMEDGALAKLVVRRKGVKPEATLLHSSSEGAIPGKREMVRTERMNTFLVGEDRSLCSATMVVIVRGLKNVIAPIRSQRQ